VKPIIFQDRLRTESVISRQNGAFLCSVGGDGCRPVSNSVMYGEASALQVRQSVLLAELLSSEM
jgi:hypothetical protein